ncbi:MAG TPA: MFS transporter [Candidatus Binataceae bacterium]
MSSTSDPFEPLVDRAAAVPDATEGLPTSAMTGPTVPALLAALFYVGYAGAIPAIASTWIARGFGLDQSAIAAVFAWLALSSLGSLGLARMVDRVGRRRVLVWSMAAMPACALGATLATNLALFVAFAIALGAFVGAAGSASIVMLAEALPIARRAHGQSLAGLAAAAGAGICVFLMPLLDAGGWSWRWMFALAAAAIVFLPRMVRVIPESARWQRAAKEGEAARTHFYDIFIPLYRRRSITLLICTLLAAIAGEGINSWGYFHAVSVVGLSAGMASVMMIVGGGLGMLGFPLGAWSAERFGRVRTVMGSGVMVAAGALLFYWGPPAGFAHPALWLCASFSILNTLNNVVTVASNAAATELFPTALRGTMFGWFALLGAVGSLTAESTISILARRLGGLSIVVGWLAMLAAPGALLFGTLSETQGLSLEAAANEDAFREVRG